MKKLTVSTLIVVLLLTLFVVSPAYAKKPKPCKEPPVQALIFHPRVFQKNHWCRPTQTPTDPADPPVVTVTPSPSDLWLPPLFDRFNTKEEIDSIRYHIQ